MLERFELFTVLVSRASRYIRRLKTEEMEDFALKSPHVSCLYYLYTMGAMTAKELREACGEDKANLSRSIDDLEKKGYIAPSAEGKGYKAPLRLTESGRALGEKISQKITEILHKASEGLTDEERKIFYKSFSLINDNLEKICKEYEE